MKKFIISFTFRGFHFTAKVHLIHSKQTVLFSIATVENPLECELNAFSMVFTELNGNWILILAEPSGELHTVPWRIRSRYVANDVHEPEEVFSLS